MFSQRGNAGELRAASIVAATFGPWSLERPDETLGASAATVDVEQLAVVDVFRFEHDRMDLWLDCGRAWWVWRSVNRLAEARWQTRGGPP